MADDTQATPAGEFTCSCGAVYKVTHTRAPFPDTGRAECECCGKLIKSWHNQTSWPSYKLIRKP